MLALLLLLILPSDVKAQTQKHLQALQNISATETVGKYSYPVAIFGNREQADRAPHFHGPQILNAWSGLLRESLFWKYELEGDIDGHFTFKDQCEWMERGRKIIPCSGEILSKNTDIEQITIRYQTEKWGEVVLSVKYGEVQLSEARFVPIMGLLRWSGGEMEARWSAYRELRATEPKVSEWSDDENGNKTGNSSSVNRGNSNSVYESLSSDNCENSGGRDTSGGKPLLNVEGHTHHGDTRALLAQPLGETKTVKLKKWWRIWR